MQKLLEIYEKTANEIAAAACNEAFVGTYNGFSPLTYIEVEAKWFLVSISLVGMAISGFAFYSIGAAYNAVFNIAAVFDSFRPSTPNGGGNVYDLSIGGQSFKAPLLTGGGLPGGAKSGFSAAWWIPFALFASWIVSLAFLGWQSYFAGNAFLKAHECRNQLSYVRSDHIFVPQRRR